MRSKASQANETEIHENRRRDVHDMRRGGVASAGHGRKYAGSGSAGAGDFRVAELKTIYISAQADAGEQSIASRLRDAMGKLYQTKVELKKEIPARVDGRLCGQGGSVASGIISAEELEAVKHDGYVLRGRDGRIALAGFKPQGTIYGAYALLRRLGLEMYPWHGTRGGVSGDHALEILLPLNDGLLQAFEVSDKPFFEHRDAFGHLDGGRWGATIRQYALSDPQTAANQDLFGRDRKPGYTKLKLVGKAAEADYVAWDHVAGYLVPRDLYYETHPEYFACSRTGSALDPKPSWEWASARAILRSGASVPSACWNGWGCKAPGDSSWRRKPTT